MRPRSTSERIDLGVYPQSLFLLLRNPIIVLGPLLASVLTAVVNMLAGSSGSIWGAATIFGLIELVLRVFGLAIAVIVADMVWRRGRTSFDEAWEESRRKGGDIMFAGLGLSMLISVAMYLGSIFDGTLAMGLGAIAWGVFIYAVPATTIGGVQGGMSLQASLDLAKTRPINTIILAVASLVVLLGLGFYVPAAFFSGYGTFFLIGEAFLQAIATGYIATCLAKRYADAAFRNF